MRWLYHALPRSQATALLADAASELAPATVESFVHASFLPQVEASARLYVPHDPVALLIDPRRVPHRVEVVSTPRGPMPHIHGAVPRDALVGALELGELSGQAADQVVGTRFAFVAFEGMTLLDLVGVLDPVSRIASMGFDPESTCEVVSGTLGTSVWEGAGARLSVAKVRPNLGGYDVVILPGGPGAHSLVRDTAFLRWLETYPPNRLAASVCTGSLLWAAAGRLRGKHATTHASAFDALRGLGAQVSDTPPRLVADTGTLTAGGVTAGLDLGLELVRRVAGEATAAAIARQMELPAGFGA